MTTLLVLLGVVAGYVLRWWTDRDLRYASTTYADQTFDRAREQAMLADRLDRFRDSDERMAEVVSQQVKTTLALDATVGNILTALVSSGVVRTVARAHEAQFGEVPVTRAAHPTTITVPPLIPPASEDELR